MLRQFAQAALGSAAIAVALASCGPGDGAGRVVRLEFDSASIVDGVLPLNKGVSSLIGVKAYDADGKEVDADPGDFSWSSMDISILETKTLGSAALITGTSDWFDLQFGFEPNTYLFVHYGNDEDAPYAYLPVTVVVDASGRWRIEIQNVAEQDATLTQQGREVMLVGTDGDASGTITGDTFVLDQQGYLLTGTFTSRDEVSGTFTRDDLTGRWNARKLD